MKLFYLPNLSAAMVQTKEIPDGETPHVPRCPDFGGDKTKYRAWCLSAETDHVFYSTVEGLNSGHRVSSSNQPYWIHGLIGEFDAFPGAEGWKKDLERNAGIVPTWIHRSFSGRVRMIWAFEKPAPWMDAYGARFYKEAWKCIKPKRLVAGWEEKESSDPTHYFEFGHDWERIGEPVCSFTVNGWVSDACSKVNWSKEGGVELPIEEVRKECERKWPGRWPGGWDAFTLDAVGVRFWAPEADASSVHVKPTGLLCFTGDQPFIPWATLLGAPFVDRLCSDNIGRAIEGFWWEHEKARYWERYEDGKKVQLRKEDLIAHLEHRGLS